MQPLHSREARWFFQWDYLELLRGCGISFFIIGILFFLAFALGYIALQPSSAVRLSAFGILLFALACCLDSGKPHELRKVRCRSCGSVAPMGAIMQNCWRCRKCGAAGRFDNLE